MKPNVWAYRSWYDYTFVASVLTQVSTVSLKMYSFDTRGYTGKQLVIVPDMLIAAIDIGTEVSKAPINKRRVLLLPNDADGVQFMTQTTLEEDATAREEEETDDVRIASLRVFLDTGTVLANPSPELLTPFSEADKIPRFRLAASLGTLDQKLRFVVQTKSGSTLFSDAFIGVPFASIVEMAERIHTGGSVWPELMLSDRPIDRVALTEKLPYAPRPLLLFDPDDSEQIEERRRDLQYPSVSSYADITSLTRSAATHNPQYDIAMFAETLRVDPHAWDKLERAAADIDRMLARTDQGRVLAAAAASAPAGLTDVSAAGTPTNKEM